MFERFLLILAVASCGGGTPAAAVPAAPPVPVKKAPLEPAETEVDRENQRRKAAREIVPESSSCLPPILRKSTGPRLEVAAIGNDAIACAIDTDSERLLGSVACWHIDLASGELRYREPAPLPGVGFSVRFDDRCARGYCLPAAAEVPASGIAQVAYDLKGARVAVVAGGELHLFDTKSRKRTGGFELAGVDGEPAAVHFVEETIFVVGRLKKTAMPGAVWVFKTDGTAQGPIQTPEGKNASTVNGSLLLLDKTRVAVAEQGFTSVIVYELETGKRTRVTRALPRSPCTPAEVTAYWEDDDDVTPSEKCKAYLDKTFTPFVGATGVAGSRNWLLTLRGPRIGTLAIVDGTLTEKRAIDLAWCEAARGDKDE